MSSAAVGSVHRLKNKEARSSTINKFRYKNYMLITLFCVYFESDRPLSLSKCYFIGLIIDNISNSSLTKELNIIIKSETVTFFSKRVKN